MADSTIDTIERLLTAVLDEVDESELQYRLRTALQLLTVVEAQSEAAQVALANADLGPELRSRLADLGYLD